MYLSVVIPSLRTIATPLAEETAEVRLEAMTVLSAANVLIILCLCAILMLQAGQAYAHRSVAREVGKMRETTKIQ